MGVLYCLLILFLVSSQITLVLSQQHNLEGAWHDGSSNYKIVSTSLISIFNASCLSDSCSTWTEAILNVTNEESGSILIVFVGEHGRNHTGVVDKADTLLSWSDGSEWQRVLPPNPPRFTVDVVVIPHSHDDAGWQRSFEGYYEAEVNPIYNNVMSWLSSNNDAKFILVESSFMQRWWVDQNESMRQQFKSFVDSNRLELVGGGYTMHDEESTNVYSSAVNMEYGLTWLQQTFNRKPRFLWQIDPSGHAALTPTLAAMLGYDAIVLDRVPDPVRQQMRRDGALQFVWTAINTSVVYSPSILAIVLDSFYCTVGLDGTTPQELAQSFYADIVRRAENSYLPDASGKITVLWPWGCDFAFQHMSDFDLMASVLGELKAHPESYVNVTARIGTLSDYFDTLHSQSIKFPTQGKRDFHAYVWCFEPENPSLCDHLPTTPDPGYWRTGMYSSKVELKGLSRTVDSSTHAADALVALTFSSVTDDWISALGLGRSTLSLLTHHDAITGTAYETCSLGPPYTQCNCYSDYIQRMVSARNATETVQAEAKAHQLALSPSTIPQFSNATTASASLGLNTSSDVLILAISNPLAWARREIVRNELLSGGSSAIVTDLRSRTLVSSQIVFDSLRNSTWLYFLADIPPLSTVSYSVSVTPGSPARPNQPVSGTPFTFSNGAITLFFDAQGRLFSWGNNSIGGDALPISSDFYFYEEVQAGSNLIGGTVYGFEPIDGKHPERLGPAPNGTGLVPIVLDAAGPLIWQLSQSINSYTLNSFRLFAPESALFPPPVSIPPFLYAAALPIGEAFEFQTRMGELPSEGLGGGSYVVSFTAGKDCTVESASGAPASALTTDASGFQVLKRPSFNASSYAQSQVWPAWPGFSFQFGPCDDTTFNGTGTGCLGLSASRPMGAAIQGNASVWQMIHRRILNALDPRGNDSTIIDEAEQLAIVDSSADINSWLAHRQVSSRLLAHPLTIHGAIYSSIDDFLSQARSSYSPSWLIASLPSGVHLHSIFERNSTSWYPPSPGSNSSKLDEPHVYQSINSSGSSLLLAIRLQQLPYASPIAFNFSDFIEGDALLGVQEVTIDLNSDKATADEARLVWLTQDDDNDEIETRRRRHSTSTSEIEFDSEYVRSYLVEISML